MHFHLSEEQQLLQDSVERFVAREYPFDRRQRIVAGVDGFSREVWMQLAGLGLLALPYEEHDGGLDGGAVEMMIVARAFGRGLLLEPWIASGVLAASILRDAASPTQRDAWLPGLMDGTCIASLAHAEPSSRHERSMVSTTARAVGDGFVLSGRKSLVPHGGDADLLLVSARTGGEVGDPMGISLFAVPRKTARLTSNSYQLQDGQRAADIVLDEVQVSRRLLIGPSCGAIGFIEHAIDRGIASLCAQAVGTMGVLYDATLEHLKTRKQFGVPIGKFQALQHRMAEMLMALEHARSMLMLVTAHVDNDDATFRQRHVSAAKAAIGQAARFIGQQAVQLHGGMGVSDELIVSHCFKALTVFDLQWGDSDFHVARVSDAIAAESLAA